ncbi:hypothetical protein [Persicobacter sp. CCB-QB2]|uniref:hypothetical protein n=1 Tax=Persicobacter sp. CCB-QB2 TaxID=1561025 RepID=UPI0006A99C9B|nr:hypothetical protein [Persicobacter sp. CCB-QB2]
MEKDIMPSKLKNIFRFKFKSSSNQAFLWSGGNVFVNIIKQLLIVPFFLDVVGGEQYSIWLIANSYVFIIRSLNLGNLNFCSNEVNLMTYKGELKYQDISNGFSGIVVGLIIQVSLGFLLAMIGIFFQDMSIGLGLFGFAFILLLLARLLNQVFIIFFLRLLEPIGKIHLRIKYEVFNDLGEVILIIISLVLFRSLSAVIILLFLFQVIFTFFISYMHWGLFHSFLRNARLSFIGGVQYTKRTFGLLISFLFDKFYENGLIAFIGLLFTPLFVPIFSTTKVVSNFCLKCSTVFTEPLLPELQKQYVSNSKERLLDFFSFYWGVSSVMIVTTLLILFPYIEQVFLTWTRGELDFSMELFLWTFLGVFFLNFNNVVLQFFKRISESKLLLRYSFLRAVFIFSGLFLVLLLDVDFYNVGLVICFSELVGLIFLILELDEFLGLPYLRVKIFPFIITNISFTFGVCLFVFYGFSLYSFSIISICISLYSIYSKRNMIKDFIQV